MNRVDKNNGNRNTWWKKALEEIEKILRKVELTITKKKRVLKGIWWARNIRKTKNKNRNRKTLKNRWK